MHFQGEFYISRLSSAYLPNEEPEKILFANVKSFLYETPKHLKRSLAISDSETFCYPPEPILIVWNTK